MWFCFNVLENVFKLKDGVDGKDGYDGIDDYYNDVVV